MGKFKNEWLPKEPGKVLEIGSKDINGSYREIFKGWDYTGLDVVSGPCVDYVPSDPYDWKELASDSFDSVISGQTFEHIEFPDRTMAEIKRVLKPSGVAIIIVPSEGRKHERPDYRRYKWKDLRDLVLNNGFEVVKIWGNYEAPWFDSVAVFKKKVEEVPVQESSKEVEEETSQDEKRGKQTKKKVTDVET